MCFSTGTGRPNSSSKSEGGVSAAPLVVREFKRESFRAYARPMVKSSKQLSVHEYPECQARGKCATSTCLAPVLRRSIWCTKESVRVRVGEGCAPLAELVVDVTSKVYTNGYHWCGAQTPLTTFLEPKPYLATRTSLAQRRITSGSGALVRRRVVRATGSGVYVVSNTAEGRTLALAWRFVARSLGM